MTGSRLLLVEDTPEDSLFFRKALVQAGLQCSLEVLSDGQRVVDRLVEGDGPLPSRVVLDLKLPGLSGLEILAWIRAHPGLQHLPVIILTSSQVPSDVHTANVLGVAAFLVKPVSFKSLVEVVQGIAERWKIPIAAADPK